MPQRSFVSLAQPSVAGFARPALARFAHSSFAVTGRLAAFAAVVASCALPATANAADAALPSGAFVVRDVRVFDGTRVADATDVVVRDGRIDAVGRGLAPAGLPVVDGRGRTLLPGLIDAHVHTWGSARRDAIRFGVTTELDMFSDWHQLADAKVARAGYGPTPVADLWSAGTLATVPHGHGTEYGFPIPTVTRPEDAKAFVAARLAEGSDYIKIILEDGSAYGHPLPTLDAPTVAALADAAHAAGRMAIAHVSTEAEATEAIDAHVDALAHVFIDRPASPAFVDLARRAGTFVCATLDVAAGASGADEAARLASDPRLAPWLSQGQRDSLRAVFPSGWQHRPFLANAEESVRRLHAAGVPILAGTDAGNPATAHGVSLHGELALLVASGFTPTEALAAATSVPAQKFSLADRGRIAPGERADLLLVDGDPTTDIEATRAIVGIWKNGFAVDRTLLASEQRAAAGATVAGTLVSDFESGAVAVRFGQNWDVTTDRIAGGASTAVQAWEAGGAGGSRGAMRVSGEVAGTLPFAWAGTLFMPGAQPFEAVDFSARKAIVLQVRGPERDLTAMVFSGDASQRIPAMQRFHVTPEWHEVRLPLDRFPGADATRVRAFAVTAGQPAGPFSFDIDDVRIE